MAAYTRIRWNVSFLYSGQ